MTFRSDSTSIDETIAAGREFGTALESGDVVGLVGPLGAGKTHFVKGIAEAVESGDRVHSPTFALVHEYRGGRIPVFHFDFYRLDDPGEALQFGWEEYLDEPGIAVVEWADKFPELMPGDTRWLEIRIGEGEGREIREGK